MDELTMTMPEDLKVCYWIRGYLIINQRTPRSLKIGFDYAADVNVDELFNVFFGGSFGGQNVYVRRNRNWERQRNEVVLSVFLVLKANLFLPPCYL